MSDIVKSQVCVKAKFNYRGVGRDLPLPHPLILYLPLRLRQHDRQLGPATTWRHRTLGQSLRAECN